MSCPTERLTVKEVREPLANGPGGTEDHSPIAHEELNPANNHPTLLTYRNGEVMDACCFKVLLVSLGIVDYVAIDN